MKKLEVSHYFEKTFPYVSFTEEVSDILSTFHNEDIERLSPIGIEDEFEILEVNPNESNVFYLETHLENFKGLLSNFSDMIHTFPGFSDGLKLGLLDYYTMTKGLLKYAVYEDVLENVSNERLNLKIGLVLLSGLFSKETKIKHDVYRDLQTDISLYGLDLIISDVSNCQVLIDASKKFGKNLLKVMRTYDKDFYPMFLENKKEVCYLFKEENNGDIENA